MGTDITREGLKKVAFEARRTPPTLDSIFEYGTSNKFMATKGVKDLFGSVLLGELFDNNVEQFNFGMLKISAIREAQREAIDFIHHGLFTQPYPVCFYRVCVDYEDGQPPVGISLLLVDGLGDKETPGSACVSFTHDNDWMMAMHSINMLRTKINNGVTEVQLQVPQDEHEFWKRHVMLDDGRDASAADLADGSLVAMGLTMILNTKGVRKERTAPPAKPNKARAKAGRPLLPWVTRVYTDVYNRATEPGSGTHASPRPHRRRAHVRTYRNPDGTVKLALPIAAMLVNWDGQPLAERNQYEVR